MDTAKLVPRLSETMLRKMKEVPFMFGLPLNSGGHYDQVLRES